MVAERPRATGLCHVCRRRVPLHRYHRTMLLHKHPRGGRCEGSGCTPMWRTVRDYVHAWTENEMRSILNEEAASNGR